MRTLACFLFAALAAAAPAVSCAAPFAVQVGEARLALDAPPGFADTGFTGSPRLAELAESLTSASNRILLFAITDGDLRKFTVGDTPAFRRYMLAVTPKAMQDEWVSPRTFKVFVGDALRELGAPPAAGADPVRHLDAQPPGKAAILAELRRDPGVVSVLQGARLPAQRDSEKVEYLAYTTSLVVLRGKALSLSVYSGYETPADLEWLRVTTERWIDELHRINRR